MVAVVQKKAFKPGVWKGVPFTPERLKQFADGTNKAIAAGIKVPALNKHTRPTDDDDVLYKAAGTDNAGWLTAVEFDESDGTLGWHLEVPEAIKARIDEGTIRFTSPEFRPAYNGNDVKYSGPIIRHVAFTPVPTLNNQGEFVVAMSDDVFQFTEDDYEGPPKKDGDGDGKKGEAEGDDAAGKNPDLPADPTDKSKAEALRACLSQLGAELTSDWTLDKQGAVDELLACLKTLAKAKQEADAEKNQKPDEPETKETEGAMPFSEDEILALPVALQVKARKANEDAAARAAEVKQFSEDRKTIQREKAVASLKTLRLPPALKTRWVDKLATVQFSETEELPTLTIQDAAKDVAECIPAMPMLFDEGTEADGGEIFKPQGGGLTPEEEQKLLDRMFQKKAG